MANTPGRQKAQRKYNSKPEQIKRRAERNKSRALMVKAGRVRKGDGKDVDHNNHNTSDNTPTNLSVRSKSENRADGGPSARMKSGSNSPSSKMVTALLGKRKKQSRK